MKSSTATDRRSYTPDRVFEYYPLTFLAAVAANCHSKGQARDFIDHCVKHCGDEVALVFGSARDLHLFKADSRILAASKVLAEHIKNLLTGGGPGIMDLFSRTFKSSGNGSQVHAVQLGFVGHCPEEPSDFVTHRWPVEPSMIIERTGSLRAVANRMLSLAMPGGFGTLQEIATDFFEMALSGTPTHRPKAAKIAYFPNQFYEGLEEYYSKCIETGLYTSSASKSENAEWDFISDAPNFSAWIKKIISSSKRNVKAKHEAEIATMQTVYERIQGNLDFIQDRGIDLDAIKKQDPYLAGTLVHFVAQIVDYGIRKSDTNPAIENAGCLVKTKNLLDNFAIVNKDNKEICTIIGTSRESFWTQDSLGKSLLPEVEATVRDAVQAGKHVFVPHKDGFLADYVKQVFHDELAKNPKSSSYFIRVTMDEDPQLLATDTIDYGTGPRGREITFPKIALPALNDLMITYLAHGGDMHVFPTGPQKLSSVFSAIVNNQLGKSIVIPNRIENKPTQIHFHGKNAEHPKERGAHFFSGLSRQFRDMLHAGTINARDLENIHFCDDAGY